MGFCPTLRSDAVLRSRASHQTLFFVVDVVVASVVVASLHLIPLLYITNMTSDFMVEETYEATKARQSTWAQPDKIHWQKDAAFRSSPYRQLHHQKGIIGRFEIRLLEASNLKRSYWSALALGPVKHLGLSKAHGPISSYCVLSLVGETRKSPVVANNDHPVWTSCSYTMPLRKGLKDGTPVLLNVEMAEDATAAEAMGLPGVPSPQERVLGRGVLDIGELCLGQDVHGKPHSGVLDAWITIHKDDKEQVTGRVRVLVSYTPNGLDPHANDLVALEAFARRSLLHASCRPMVPPLLPLKVLQVRDDWLLCEYNMFGTPTKKATLKIHRNAVFVIERTNIIDGALNLALTPTDMFFNTPVGRTTAHVAAPVVQAGFELIQPALLGTRVIWAALRTTTFAGMMGVQAASHAVWSQSRDAAERRDHEASFHRKSQDSEEIMSSSQHLFV